MEKNYTRLLSCKLIGTSELYRPGGKAGVGWRVIQDDIIIGPDFFELVGEVIVLIALRDQFCFQIGKTEIGRNLSMARQAAGLAGFYRDLIVPEDFGNHRRQRMNVWKQV